MRARTLASALCIVAATTLAAGAVAAPSNAPPTAEADELTLAERGALVLGSTVSRPIEFEKNGGKYVGGVSYKLIDATPRDVLATLQNVDVLRQVLPRTREAKLISKRGPEMWVELTSGTSLVNGTYTVRIEKVPGVPEVRFRLDRTRDHDIDDVWGYFRVVEFGDGKSLVTIAVAVDVGPGIIRMFYEEGVQRIILRNTPRDLAKFWEERNRSRREVTLRESD